jgi:hypothetical protein
VATPERSHFFEVDVLKNSWSRKLFSSIRDILSGVPADHRADAADAVAARLSDAHPGQRSAVAAVTAEALAAVMPSTVTHGTLEAVIDGTSPRADLAILRRDALAKRDGAGLRAIDSALRRIETRAKSLSKSDAIANRLLAAEMVKRAEVRRRQRAADDRRASTWGALL